jgi:hypothetical protein
MAALRNSALADRSNNSGQRGEYDGFGEEDPAELQLDRETSRKAKEAAAAKLEELADEQRARSPSASVADEQRARSPSASVEEVGQQHEQTQAPNRKRSYSKVDVNPTPAGKTPHDIVDYNDVALLFHERAEEFRKDFLHMRLLFSRYGRNASPNRSDKTKTHLYRFQKLNATFKDFSEVGHLLCREARSWCFFGCGPGPSC